MSVNKDIPAFPCTRSELVEVVKGAKEQMDVTYPGMTLRDYFAAKAMQTICSEVLEDYNRDVSQVLDDIALTSYSMADAMLKARDET